MKPHRDPTPLDVRGLVHVMWHPLCSVMCHVAWLQTRYILIFLPDLFDELTGKFLIQFGEFRIRV